MIVCTSRVWLPSTYLGRYPRVVILIRLELEAIVIYVPAITIQAQRLDHKSLIVLQDRSKQDWRVAQAENCNELVGFKASSLICFPFPMGGRSGHETKAARVKSFSGSRIGLL